MNRKRILGLIGVFTCLIILLLLIVTRTKSYQSMSIEEEKWDSILKKRVESSDLKIDDIKFNEYELIIDESKSTLYYSMIKDHDNAYRPSVKFKANEDQANLVILKDELSKDKMEDYEFKIMLYDETSYHIYSLICTDYSILNIQYKGHNDKTDAIPMNIYLFDNSPNTNSRIVKSDGTINTTKNDGYQLHLEFLSPGKNERDNSISIMGMEPSSQYTLSKVSKKNHELKNEQILKLFIENKYIGLYQIEVSK